MKQGTPFFLGYSGVQFRRLLELRAYKVQDFGALSFRVYSVCRAHGAQAYRFCRGLQGVGRSAEGEQGLFIG